jgi:uncharacterized delta-60 repeat protein
VARLNLDGTLDDTFAPTALTNGVVFSLAAQSDGSVLAGGDFVTTSGTNRVGLIRLNPDGSRDSSFNPGGINGVVFGIALQSQGIVIGGSFTRVNGFTRNRYARLLPGGALDSSFDPGLGANNTVFSVVVQPDGNILIGGDFTLVTGVSRNGIARILGGAAAQIRFTSVSLAPLRLTITAEAGKSYILEASTDLINWQDIAMSTAGSGTLEFTDPNADSFNMRFYRVREASP